MIRRLMDLLPTADNNISALIGFFRIVHDEHLRNETFKDSSCDKLYCCLYHFIVDIVIVTKLYLDTVDPLVIIYH